MAAQAFVARRGFTLLGRRYRPHETVDLAGVPPVLRRRLVEQKRVVPRAEQKSRAGAADPAASHRHPEARPGTCGWFGGVRTDGSPCGWARKDRPCRFHSKTEEA